MLGKGVGARMTKFTVAIQKHVILRCANFVTLVFTCSDQILAKLIGRWGGGGGGGCCSSFLQWRCLKNFGNEKIFLSLKKAEIDMRGGGVNY